MPYLHLPLRGVTMETESEILECKARLTLLQEKVEALMDILAKDGTISHEEVAERLKERVREHGP